MTRKNVTERGPEARLYAACVAALVFPAGMFIFAWSTYARVPWIVLAIAMTVRTSPRPMHKLVTNDWDFTSSFFSLFTRYILRYLRI